MIIFKFLWQGGHRDTEQQNGGKLHFDFCWSKVFVDIQVKTEWLNMLASGIGVYIALDGPQNQESDLRPSAVLFKPHANQN